jgi:hypothetical protein
MLPLCRGFTITMARLYLRVRLRDRLRTRNSDDALRAERVHRIFRPANRLHDRIILSKAAVVHPALEPAELEPHRR